MISQQPLSSPYILDDCTWLVEAALQKVLLSFSHVKEIVTLAELPLRGLHVITCEMLPCLMKVCYWPTSHVVPFDPCHYVKLVSFCKVWLIEIHSFDWNLKET